MRLKSAKCHAGSQKLAVIQEHDVYFAEDQMAARGKFKLDQSVADLYWQGRGALERQDWRSAAAIFRRAVRVAPQDAELRRLLGLGLARLDRFDDAIASFRAAIICKPDHARAHADLGVTLLKIDRVSEAIPELETALALDAGLQQARMCLGIALSKNGEPDRALAILEPAVQHSIDPEVHSARAWAMLAQGKVADSIATLQRALRLNPRHPMAHFNLLFATQHLPGITALGLFAAHRDWAENAASRPGIPEPARRSRRGLPRIGLVSGDLRRHAVGTLTLRAFETLAEMGFDIVCFANQAEHDDYTRRYRAASVAWHRTDALGDTALIDLIRGENIDILFDLSGMTARHRMDMFARRAAPFQISWAGYTGTTGLTTMDALIADEREVPVGEDAVYTERVLRLPDCYVCYEPPAHAPDIGPLPAVTSGAICFGCFQRAPKLNAEVFALWARIAARLPGSKFVLRYACYAESETRLVVRRMAQAAGLAEDRLILETGGTNDYMLAGYNEIDIALDTFPYSGGVTTLEALWMGVPVVTRRGQTFAGRHSTSHLHAAGLHELIGETGDDYVRIAVDLAGDLPRLASLRASLRETIRRSPLMDAKRFATHLADALLSAEQAVF